MAVVVLGTIIVVALVIALVIVVMRLVRRHPQPLNKSQFDPPSPHSGGDVYHPEERDESSSQVVTRDNLIGEHSTLDA